MTAAWCRGCASKIARGATTCAVCGVAINDQTPDGLATPAPSAVNASKAQRDLDSLVELIRLDAIEAEIIAAHLRGADIHATVFGIGSAGLLSAIQHSEGSRVMVRARDLETAREIVAECYDAGDVEGVPTDAELAALADASAGWSGPDTGAVV